MINWPLFFAMGGYAPYVWPAYGLTAFLFIIMAAQSFRSAQAKAAELKRLQSLSPHRQRRREERAAPAASEVADGV